MRQVSCLFAKLAFTLTVRTVTPIGPPNVREDCCARRISTVGTGSMKLSNPIEADMGLQYHAR
jgi:hypothetical protein